MAWPQNKELEEVKKQAQDWEAKAKASEDKQKELEAKLQAQEAERVKEREHVKGIETEFQKIKSALEAKEKTPAKPEEPADFDTDPQKAFDQQVRPLAEVAVLNAKNTAKILAQQQLDNNDMASGSSMDGRFFRAWGAEIDAEANKYQPQQMITPEAWLGIFYYVKGRHSDELANPEIRKKNYAFLESGRSNTPPPPDKEEKKDQLTEEQKTIARKMGVSEEKYLENMKKFTYSGA
jgi:hypothetical protein